MSYDAWKGHNPIECDGDPDTDPCVVCGEPAVVGLLIVGHAQDVPLCGKHADEAVTVCQGCDRTIWQKDGYRLYASANLYCGSCAHQYPGLILPAQTTFEQVRR